MMLMLTEIDQLVRHGLIMHYSFQIDLVVAVRIRLALLLSPGNLPLNSMMVAVSNSARGPMYVERPRSAHDGLSYVITLISSQLVTTANRLPMEHQRQGPPEL